jgi:hypothetical protein
MTVLCGALALLGTLLAVPVAHADTVPADPVPSRLRQHAGGDGKVWATLPLPGLAAGEVRNIHSEIVVGDSRADGSPARVAVIHRITCQRVGGATIPDMSIVSSRNLLPGAGKVTLMLRLLVTAPHAGDFECRLRAYTLDGLSIGDETAMLYSGFVRDLDGPLDPAGSAQIIPRNPDKRNHESFFDLDAPGKQLNHLYGYTPPAGATSFVAVGDLLVTSCYGNGGNACPIRSYPPVSGTARVYSRVVATPSSDAPGCVSQASAPTTAGVSGPVHHFRKSHTLTVTLPATGCGTWTINIFARDDGGTLPFVVHLDGGYTVTYARPAP